MLLRISWFNCGRECECSDRANSDAGDCHNWVMSRPIVAITTYLEPARWGAWDKPAALVPEEYVAKLVDAGAAVVLLPPNPDDVSALDRVDGLLLVGGADIGPDRYGSTPQPTTDAPRFTRDGSELALYRRARELGLPVFGICRGLQVMAVAHGGRLEQHLPDHVGTLHRDAPGTFNEHAARFLAGSLVARILATTDTTVNSSHHQAVADAGSLTVTGWAEDESIEVCEDPEAPFVLGVQWHPEVMADDRLFDAFVAAAARR
jgi:putative glutamine amidotransferase